MIDQALLTGHPVITVIEEATRPVSDPAEFSTPRSAHLEPALQAILRASGVVPQICITTGPLNGSEALLLEMSDFRIGIGGPATVAAIATEEAAKINGETLPRESRNGLDLTSETLEETAQTVRALLSYLPSNNRTRPPALPYTYDEEAETASGQTTAALLEINTLENEPYDLSATVRCFVDFQDLLTLGNAEPAALNVGFARIAGRPVGIVQSDPLTDLGHLDSTSMRSTSRFLRLCDTYNLPVISFTDAPGLMPGAAENDYELLKNMAALTAQYRMLTVPLVAVLARPSSNDGTLTMGVNAADEILHLLPADENSPAQTQTTPRATRASLIESLLRLEHKTSVLGPARKYPGLVQ
nr:carboxyl transferase domain-containing protein [Arthrobacter sp. yr096]